MNTPKEIADWVQKNLKCTKKFKIELEQKINQLLILRNNSSSYHYNSNNDDNKGGMFSHWNETYEEQERKHHGMSYKKYSDD
jgi:hypothetical protein